METVYAIIHSAFTDDGSSASLAAFVIIPFHKLSYENIHGYSLGHTPEFFNTLKEAQDRLISDNCISSSYDRMYAAQQAIIELNVDMQSNSVISLGNLYEYVGYRKAFKQIQGPEGLFTEIHVPHWQEQRATAASKGALDVMNQYFAEHCAKAAKKSLPKPDAAPADETVKISKAEYQKFLTWKTREAEQKREPGSTTRHYRAGL